MIHQLVFTKLLGELDYGAGTGIGDFNAAGCASRSAMQLPCSGAAAGKQQQGPVCRPECVCGAEEGTCRTWRRWGVLCIALVRVLLIGVAPDVADGAGFDGVQLQQRGRVDLEHPQRRLDLPGAPASARVIAPRPRRRLQPADVSFSGCAVLRQRIRRRTRAAVHCLACICSRDH
jgi:hypothetical protein